MTNTWEKFTQQVSASPLIKAGVSTLTFLIDNMQVLISLVSTLGGRFLAMKAPAWLSKFIDNNFGGGKVGSFFGNLIGGNEGFIGSRINARRQRKINQKYDEEISAIDAMGTADTRLQMLEASGREISPELEKKLRAQDALNANKKKELEAARQKELEDSQWVKDPSAKKETGVKQTNSLLEQIYEWLKTNYGSETSESVKADLEAADAANQKAQADRQSAQADIEEANGSRQATQADLNEAGASNAAAAGAAPGEKKGLLSFLQGKTGQKIMGAVGAGIGGFASGFATNSVGDTGIQGWYNTTGQTVEADAGDKWIKAGLQGGLAAAGTAFLGPLGGMLGNIIGGGIADLISYFRHKDELERKARVEEAKKRLEVLSEAKNSLDDFAGTITSYVLTGDEYKAAEEAVSKFAETLWADSSLAEQFSDTLKKVNADLGNLSIGELTDKMLNGTAEEKQEIAQAMDLTLARQVRQQTEASLEQDIYDNNKAMQEGVADKGSGDISGLGTSINSTQGQVLEAAKKSGLISNLMEDDGQITNITLAGVTAEDRAANAKEILGDLAQQGVVSGDLVDNLQKVVEKYDEVAASQKKINKELNTQDVNIGYIASGVSDLSKAQQQAITYEGAIQMVADAMEQEGLEVRNSAGIIKDDYLPLIESAIKSDTKLTELVKGETITYGSLAKAQTKMAVSLKELQKTDSSITWKALKELNDYATPANIAQLDKYAEELGMTRDQLRGLIEQSDPQRLQNFADALGVSLETLQSWGPGLENLSQSFVLELSPEKVREAKTGYQSLYDDIITTGKMSAENMEKIVSDYPNLIPYLGDETALRQEIGKILGPEGALNKAYKQSMFMTLQTSSDFFKQFKENTNIKEVMDNFFKGMADGVQKNELKKTWENATTFEQAFEVLQSDLIEKGSETAEAVQKALEEQFNFTMKIQQDTSEWDRVMEYQKTLLDDQINNLNEQKEALSTINDERKKELNLIKAKEALENAKKEKKMVYRAGIGFTYEADEEAISEAKDNLNDLQTQKQQEALDMEIQKLELEKQILEYIPTVEDQEQLKQLWTEWTEEMQETNGSLADWTGQMASTYKKYSEIDFAEIFKEFQNAAEERRESKVGQMKEEYQKLLDVQKEIADFLAAGGDKESVEYNDLVAKYNAQYDSYENSIKTAKSLGASQEMINEATGAISSATIAAIDDTEAAANHTATKKQMVASALGMDAGEINDTEMEALVAGMGDKLLSGGKKAEERLKIHISRMDSNNSGAGIEDQDYYTSDEDVDTGFLDKQFSVNDCTHIMLPFTKDGKTMWGNPDTQTAGWMSLKDYNLYAEEGKEVNNYNDFKKLPTRAIIGNSDYDDYFIYKDGSGRLKHMVNADGNYHKLGTLGIQNEDYSLINEVGTEGIVTPQGTFTALPSHTGIVPADITKNVWQLGEVAPQLVAKLDSLKNPGYVANTNNGVTNNDTTNIGTVNVYPVKDYDMDKLITEAKAQAKITKNNN